MSITFLRGEMYLNALERGSRKDEPEEFHVRDLAAVEYRKLLKGGGAGKSCQRVVVEDGSREALPLGR